MSNWLYKKPPTYCRAHGRRIQGFVIAHGRALCLVSPAPGLIGCCDRCIDRLAKTVVESLTKIPENNS